jgi:arylsulfatase A-like enzyme
VPTIVWAPGLVKPGESDALLSQVDFLASFAHLAGKDLGLSEKADSLQMADAILGKSKNGRDNLVTEGIGAKTLLREGSWVFIPAYTGPKFFGDKKVVESGYSNEPQLYDLSADIGQRKNLAAAHPDRVAAMSELLTAIRERRNPIPPAESTSSNQPNSNNPESSPP